jgi:hypothetical protein
MIGNSQVRFLGERGTATCPLLPDKRVLGISHTTRKPILLLRLSGVLLLRVAERQLRGLLFQEPPRFGLPVPLVRLA